MQLPSRHKRRSAWLLRACCGAAVVGLLPAVELVAFTASSLWSHPRWPSAASAANAHGLVQMPSRVTRQAIDGLEAAQATAASVDALGAAGFLDTSLLTSFADQAGNINGVLFQSSLPAYLLFLYFLSFRGNNTPPLVQFGFGFLLCFVLLTIPTGIISKSSYGLILADSDWLHGSAESLLTCTNIMIVLGFRGALLGAKDVADNSVVRNVALVWLATVIVTLATGIPVFGFEAHTPFLSGLGALPADPSFAAEPVNALSIPNWMVHWSTVFEFLLAMSLAWRYADASGNPKWKGLTWGMFPSSISSVCALTFHIFYNQIPWILTAQALFTFIGNATLALASYRIAASNGWTVSELDPRPALSKAFAKITGGEKADDEDSKGRFDISRVSTAQADELTSGPLLVAEGVLLTLAFAYGTKYGELAFGANVFQSPESTLAAALVVALPVSLVGYTIYSNSADLQRGEVPSLALAGAVTAEVSPGASAASIKEEVTQEKSQGLSFEDVKKYGVAGTVAYVFTELAFWAVATPFAAWSLYTTTGHWPELLTSNDDRVAVAGFVFAGANVARLAVPLRLGAALALAPWVDENVTSKLVGSEKEEAPER